MTGYEEQPPFNGVVVLNSIPVIQQATRSNSRYEMAFIDFCKRYGYQVYRPGWPDFLVLDTKGEYTKGRWSAVEVKQKESDRLMAHQLFAISVLAANGVNTKLWTPTDGETDYMFNPNSLSKKYFGVKNEELSSTLPSSLPSQNR